MAKIILDWTELASELEANRADGKNIVTTNGVFDVLHVGHVRYLQAARNLGDCLVVGVNSDECANRLKGPGRPFVPAAERMEMLAALACVDFVTIFNETTPEALLEAVRPNVHAKGGDYHIDLLPEGETVRRHGGVVVTLPFEAGHSTTSLAEQIGAVMAGHE